MKVRIPDHVAMADAQDLTKGKLYEMDENESIIDDVGDELVITPDIPEWEGLVCYHLGGKAAWEVVNEA